MHKAIIPLVFVLGACAAATVAKIRVMDKQAKRYTDFCKNCKGPIDRESMICPAKNIACPYPDW